MQLPSNKVGLTLIIVVLGVASTIFFTKIGTPQKIVDLQNVDLLVERNTNTGFKSGDTDEDGLLDWQEELYGSDVRIKDTDGDGTNDGDEIQLKRDPIVAGPNDPLLTTKDFFDMDVDMTAFATGTITEKLSVDLFSQYLNLKKNNEFTEEKQAELINSIAQNAIESTETKDYFVKEDMNMVQSTLESVKKYGEEFAQISTSYYIKMDNLRNLPESSYLSEISGVYSEFAQSLADIEVPGVAVDVHLELSNRIYETGRMLEAVSKSNTDPVVAMVAIGKHQASASNDLQLYTSLAKYFSSNGIIFDDTISINFWNYYKN